MIGIVRAHLLVTKLEWREVFKRKKEDKGGGEKRRAHKAASRSREISKTPRGGERD